MFFVCFVLFLSFFLKQQDLPKIMMGFPRKCDVKTHSILLYQPPDAAVPNGKVTQVSAYGSRTEQFLWLSLIKSVFAHLSPQKFTIIKDFRCMLKALNSMSCCAKAWISV